MRKSKVVALLLAGGQGSRLGVLTQRVAKPAVPYGGNYRIIDFSLSNCVNSDIGTVGVLTQYQPLELSKHIGIGKPWDMDRMHGGVTILPPHLKSQNGEWYKGTANAVYQNIHYVDSLNPDHVLILSGDHIYKMDYSKMLKFHKSKNAEATISVITVPIEEASRYGIMSATDEGEIYKFQEKPKNPDSTLASMGVYIFNWSILRDYLIKDNEDHNSDHDFGKNVIPALLKDKRSMWAYNFDGYWKDVGTVQAYWESNMDLIRKVPDFNLFDPSWKIYTPNRVKPAQYVGSEGVVRRSIIAEGCVVNGIVENSVLFPGVVVESGVVLKDSIVMSDCTIRKNTIVERSIICENVEIGEDVFVGFGEDLQNEEHPHIYNSGITVIGEGSKIPDGCKIGKNVMVDINVNHKELNDKYIMSGKNVRKGG